MMKICLLFWVIAAVYEVTGEDDHHKKHCKFFHFIWKYYKYNVQPFINL